MLPFECIIDSPPVSAKTRYTSRLDAWQETIRTIVAQSWPVNTPPVQEDLSFSVTYYHEGIAVRMNNDDLVKPIQIALTGLVYADIKQITDTYAWKVDLNGSFRVQDMSPLLARAFCRGNEFLYIRVDIAP